MPSSTRPGLAPVLGAAALACAMLVAVPSQAAPGSGKSAAAAQRSNNLYIVQMTGQPVVAYTGGVAGLAATRPARGQKIDPQSPQVVSYLAHLHARQDAAAARVGARKVYNYGFAFNGFAAEMSPAQAEQLRQSRDVLAVTKDEARRMDTATTPAFLGLSGPTGVWAAGGATGENVVIGIVDSGVWPEHPSFSDRVGSNGNASKEGSKLDYTFLPGWRGRCVPGQLFPSSLCNQKLIGARWYSAGYGGDAAIRDYFPYEYVSARDADSHGTHTATTAGGNANVRTTGEAAVLGAISGIAPRARIAAYKVCWGRNDEGGCFNTDSVAAIDQAVADGVDVINFSISGSRTSFRDPVEIAFLFAADAGVFVATSAGNSGPTTSTVAHPSPWVTTVAAGTHNRDGTGAVTLGNGASYAGASAATAVSAKPIILAANAGLPGADPTALALCFNTADNGGSAVLDPAKVAGKIVVCDRGVTARTNKSLAVKEAGGAGMVLVNTSNNSINADLHFVPTVHLNVGPGTEVKAYAGSVGASASIAQSTLVTEAVAPFTATFSSRGPLLAAGGDLLKPDVIAPGQDILAGVSPPGANGRLFDLLSGTSMSSPHVAGLAALMKQKYPGWSPMAIKSALMTSASDVLDGPNTNPLLIFRQGAGHVQPAKALNPGLVFDSGFSDWLSFLCGAQPGGGCSGVTPMDPSDLNVASIAIGDLAGTQTIKRRVTAVGSSGTWTATMSGLAGFNAVVSPSSFTLTPGQSQDITVAFTRTSATLSAYTGGQLTWSTSDNARQVRIPVVLRPVALAAPAEASAGFDVTFGYTGPFTVTPRGLVEAVVTADSVADDPTDGACSPNAPNAKVYPVVIPAGITLARWQLFDADVSPGADIDLCVFNAAGALVGSSGSGTSAEVVTLANPAAGTYLAVVQGWGVIGSSPFRLHSWMVGSADAGNMTVTAPASATIGVKAPIGLSFTGLTSGRRYLGSLVYGGSSGMPTTVISVTAP